MVQDQPKERGDESVIVDLGAMEESQVQFTFVLARGRRKFRNMEKHGETVQEDSEAGVEVCRVGRWSRSADDGGFEQRLRIGLLSGKWAHRQCAVRGVAPCRGGTGNVGGHGRLVDNV